MNVIRDRVAAYCRSIALTRFPAMFSTCSFRSLKVIADGPSSLSGGFGVKLPILVPFKSKTRTASKCVSTRRAGLCVNRWPGLQTLATGPIRALTIWLEIFHSRQIPVSAC